MKTLIPGMDPITLVSYYEEFEWYYENCEMMTKQWFVEHAGNDWNFIDCGANIGYYSILFSRLSPHGHVWAIEPTKTIEMLKRNLAHHGVENVSTHEMAVGSRSGTFEDDIYRVWGKPPEKKNYKFITIDAFIQKQAIERLDCIKIDVDSFDFEVLQGAKETFERFNPFIVVELNHALIKRNQSNAEALLWMRQNGYTDTLCIEYENYVFKRYYKFDSSNAIKIHFN